MPDAELPAEIEDAFGVAPFVETYNSMEPSGCSIASSNRAVQSNSSGERVNR